MSHFKNHKNIMYIFGGLIILMAIIIPRVFKKGSTTDQSMEYKPLVSIIDVNKYAGNIKQFDTEAKIEAKGQVELKSQISAPVQNVNVGIGDTVYAGQTLLSLKNDDISAQVSQAQANLASAQARLADIKKGIRSEEIAIYEQQYTNSERDMNNAVRDIYTKIEDSVRNKTDLLFRNAGSVNPEIIIRTQNRDTELSINLKRLVLDEKLKNDFSSNELITSEKEIVISENIMFAKGYFDLLANIVNDLSTNNSGISQSTIDGYRLSVSSAQIQVNASASAYSSAVSVWKIANNNLILKKAGATTEQMTLAGASVSQAQAALQGAQSLYNKSIITSPISGTVSSLPFRVGDLVPVASLVASVVNKDGLELKGYISGEDAQYIKEGDRVLIENKYNSEISRISPSVDSQTKKVEFKVLLNDKNNSLIIGDNSHVKIFSNASSTNPEKVYTLPISSINVSNSGYYVYTISTSTEEELNPIKSEFSLRKIVGHKVMIGEVSGENITVTDGIEKDMSIITPIIGLKDGAVVRIKN